LLERDGEFGELPAGRLSRDRKRPRLTDRARRLFERDCRGGFAAGDVEDGAGGNQEKDNENSEDSGHANILNSPHGLWRYRLGVRTHGSQPWNPGSIPGTATILRPPKLSRDHMKAEDGLRMTCHPQPARI